MRVITVANIVLNRPRSLSRSGFASHLSAVRYQIEIASHQPGDLLAKVRELAIEVGENRHEAATLEISPREGGGPSLVYIREPQSYGGTHYGVSYATCEVFPALEIDGRYFRVQEVELTREP